MSSYVIFIMDQSEKLRNDALKFLTPTIETEAVMDEK